jgi:hypothetical protein
MLEALIVVPIQATSNQLAQETCMLRASRAFNSVSEGYEGEENTEIDLDDGFTKKKFNFVLNGGGMHKNRGYALYRVNQMVAWG